MTKIRSSSTSRVQDNRGQSASRGGGGLGGALGGGGLNIPGGVGGMGSLLRGGGGMAGLLLMAAVIILPKLLGSAGSSSSVTPAAEQSTSADAVPSGVDSGGDTACSTEIEQIVCGAVDDVSDYWINQAPASFNIEYSEAPTVFFSDGVDTGCGYAPSTTGPFYCPADHRVYFDLAFMEQLQQQFNATGDLASQYIVAHEYGHHIQNITGINDQVRQAQQKDPSRANQYSIALELQADCFAGAWAKNADERQLLEAGEVAEALNAAAAVGDDNIQMETSGRVDQDSWTHGSSQQRTDWFNRGFTTGDPNQCTTFNEVL